MFDEFSTNSKVSLFLGNVNLHRAVDFVVTENPQIYIIHSCDNFLGANCVYSPPPPPPAHVGDSAVCRSQYNFKTIESYLLRFCRQEMWTYICMKKTFTPRSCMNWTNCSDRGRDVIKLFSNRKS